MARRCSATTTREPKSAPRRCDRNSASSRIRSTHGIVAPQYKCPPAQVAHKAMKPSPFAAFNYPHCMVAGPGGRLWALPTSASAKPCGSPGWEHHRGPPQPIGLWLEAHLRRPVQPGRPIQLLNGTLLPPHSITPIGVRMARVTSLCKFHRPGSGAGEKSSSGWAVTSTGARLMKPSGFSIANVIHRGVWSEVTYAGVFGVQSCSHQGDKTLHLMEPHLAPALLHPSGCEPRSRAHRGDGIRHVMESHVLQPLHPSRRGGANILLAVDLCYAHTG